MEPALDCIWEKIDPDEPEHLFGLLAPLELKDSRKDRVRVGDKRKLKTLVRLVQLEDIDFN